MVGTSMPYTQVHGKCNDMLNYIFYSQNIDCETWQTTFWEPMDLYSYGLEAYFQWE